MTRKKVFFSIIFICVMQRMMSSDAAQRIHFESAHYTQKQFLVDFAIQSNAIYKTCIASRAIAENVFDLHEDTFKHGVVELLKDGDEIIGFFSLKIDKDKTDRCELGHLFVKAGLQRRGFGSVLFARAVRTAQQKGFRKIVWISDPDAKDFYVKKGALMTAYGLNSLNPAAPVLLFEYCTSE